MANSSTNSSTEQCTKSCAATTISGLVTNDSANAGTYGRTLRWMPPLVVNEREIDLALAAFGAALKATA